ncbi:hypothetical protein [Streptomyces sp. NPDC007346]
MMTHIVLTTGLIGLMAGLYARTHDLRFLGGLAALLGLGVALLWPEAW